MHHVVKSVSLAVALFFLLTCTAGAQNNFDSVQIHTTPLAGTVSMMTGAGGNMGVCAGDDGAFLVDAEYAPLTQKIVSAVNEMTKKPIKYLFNTHYHGDHVSGNENFGKAGVTIVAHDNIRQRMSTDQFNPVFNMKTPAYPAAALPAITYTDEITFHINGEDIHCVHVPNAHTNGDGFVHFMKANVINTGDLFFNGIYPFIDVNAGGSINGMIAAADKILSMANADTKIIPGHGPLSNADGLRKFQKMLVGIRDNVQKLVKEGKSADEVKAAKPTKEYDAEWGNGFMKPDTFTGIVYSDLSKK